MTPIPASTQFAAIAYLRWRLFATAFRRKEGAGELAARLIVYPVGLLFLLGPMAGALFGTYAAVSSGHIGLMSLIFWLITTLQILVSVNLSPAALSFDTEALIRFPISFPRFLTIRLFLGLLSPSTIAGT
jgi:ABC-2 type transport system permease protein